MGKALFISILCGISAVFFVLVVVSAPSRPTSALFRDERTRDDPRLSAIFFDSPDETANYFWAKRVAEGGGLWYEESLEGVGNSLLKPRSFNVIGDRVVPGSFIGLSQLYGYMAQWIGVGVIPYLTPLFTSLAVVAFGLLIGKLFGRPIGVLSAALLTVLPPWWYYTARGMYHNVLFVSLVMIGISILVHLITSHARDGHCQTRKVTQGDTNFLLRNSRVPTSRDTVPISPPKHASSLSELARTVLTAKFGPLSFGRGADAEGLTNGQSLAKHIMRGWGGRWWKLLRWGVAGLLIGFSLVVRSSEVVWVGVLVGSLLVYWFIGVFKSGRWKEVSVGLLLFFACGIFALVPLFATNIELYGAPISIGYRGVQGMELGEFLTRLPEAQFRNLFFAPFGVNLDHVRVTVKSFFIDFLWWWFWPAVIGMLFVLVAVIVRAKKIRNYSPPISNDRYIWGVNWKRWGAYLLVYLCVSLLLIFYYGSWEFSDRIDRRAVSLNTSFLRYWLTVYVMGVPFVSLLIYWFTHLFKWRWEKIVVAVMAIGLFAYPSASLVLTDKDESLGAVRTRLVQAHVELETVKEYLPPDVVIITFPQADKVLFPTYTRLITALVNQEDYRAVERLTQTIPVYYYTYSPPGMVEFLDIPLFKRYGLTLIEGQRVYAQRWMWRVVERTEALAQSLVY